MAYFLLLIACCLIQSTGSWLVVRPTSLAEGKRSGSKYDSYASGEVILY
jgi:hypothetical protein